MKQIGGILIGGTAGALLMLLYSRFFSDDVISLWIFGAIVGGALGLALGHALHEGILARFDRSHIPVLLVVILNLIPILGIIEWGWTIQEVLLLYFLDLSISALLSLFLFGIPHVVKHGTPRKLVSVYGPIFVCIVAVPLIYLFHIGDIASLLLIFSNIVGLSLVLLVYELALTLRERVGDHGSSLYSSSLKSHLLILGAIFFVLMAYITREDPGPISGEGSLFGIVLLVGLILGRIAADYWAYTMRKNL